MPSTEGQERIEAIVRAMGHLSAAEFDFEIDITAEDDLAMVEYGVTLLRDEMQTLYDRQRQQIAKLAEQLRTIETQSQAIMELSTPVIQVWDEILVLPLIGTIDTARAQQIMENLLEAVVKRGAKVVIIDITGVPVVDTSVADHLVKTIQATRLLGAETMLTGVGPRNARTLVALKVELGRITTSGSLQAGLKLAFDRTRQRVSEISDLPRQG